MAVRLNHTIVPARDEQSVHPAFLVDEPAGAGEHRRRREGVYVEDPSGHFLEAITVPYGGF